MILPEEDDIVRDQLIFLVLQETKYVKKVEVFLYFFILVYIFYQAFS